LKPVNRKVPKNKIDKRNTFLILIQIQNRIKITTTQIERQNILTRNEMKKLVHTSNMKIKRFKECNLSKPTKK